MSTSHCNRCCQHCATFCWSSRRYSRRFFPRKARIYQCEDWRRRLREAGEQPGGERVRGTDRSLIRQSFAWIGLDCGKGRRRDEGKVSNRQGWLLACASVRNQGLVQKDGFSITRKKTRGSVTVSLSSSHGRRILHHTTGVLSFIFTAKYSVVLRCRRG